MQRFLVIKQKIYSYVEELLNRKLKELKESLNAAKESRNSDTKSSAGDKHETSRALAQVEIDKLEAQLHKTLLLQKEFFMLDREKEYPSIGPGCLVFTNQENYFISIALGKIVLENHIFYAISLASPLGKNLIGKKKGEKFIFQGREIIIEFIV